MEEKTERKSPPDDRTFLDAPWSMEKPSRHCDRQGMDILNCKGEWIANFALEDIAETVCAYINRIPAGQNIEI